MSIYAGSSIDGVATNVTTETKTVQSGRTRVYGVHVSGPNQAGVLEFKDGGATGTHAKESLADLVTLLAGTGLSASSSIINIDASQPTITSIGQASATLDFAAGDLTMFNPVDSGHPSFRIGKDANDNFMIQSLYDAGAQTFDYVMFKTFSTNASANKGQFKFLVDEAPILNIDDGGIDIATNKGISINGADILTDSSGTATLSNIDALDATTEATIESAIDTLGNLTSASSLATIGTISSGTWRASKIDDAYTNTSGRRYGSTIKILPSDWMINDDAASPLSFKDGSNSGVHVNDTANEMIAFVTIPEGMKATHVDVYATNNKVVEVWELDVNASFDFTGTPKETGNANTQITVSPNIDATAINFLAIIYKATATSNRVWGGLVTIAAQ